MSKKSKNNKGIFSCFLLIAVMWGGCNPTDRRDSNFSDEPILRVGKSIRLIDFHQEIVLMQSGLSYHYRNRKYLFQQIGHFSLHQDYAQNK